VKTKCLEVILLLCMFGFLTYMLSAFETPIFLKSIYTATIIVTAIYEVKKCRRVKISIQTVRTETKNRKTTRLIALLELNDITSSKKGQNRRRSRRLFLLDNPTRCFSLHIL